MMKRVVLWALLIVFAVLAAFGYHAWQHWLAYATGSYNCPLNGCPGGSAHNYNFFSGFGSDLTEFAIVGGILGAYHKHNCHDEHCWRIGKHVVDGTPWCNRHHNAARDRAKEVLVLHGPRI
jgi:hypothetical protein